MIRIIAAFAGFLALLQAGTAHAIPQSFDLQPVTICETGHPETCLSPGFDASYLQSIYAQLDISVNVLPTSEITTLALLRDGSGDIDPIGPANDGAVFQFRSELIASTDPNTIYMGYTGELIGNTLGVAFVDAPFSPFGVVENFFAIDDDAGLIAPGDEAQTERMATAVLAHEIGHVLGGEHENTVSGNLMFPTISFSSFASAAFIPSFSVANAAEIIASPILAAVSAVPVQGGLPALMLCFGMLALLRRRRRTSSA